MWRIHHNFYLTMQRKTKEDYKESRLFLWYILLLCSAQTCNSSTDEMAETAAHNDPEDIVQAHQNNGGQLKKTSRLVHCY